MRAMDSYILMVIVTGDQEDAIENLFQCKGWKYEKAGSVPMSRGEIQQKHHLDRKGDNTSSNVHQRFSQPYLEHQSQFENSFLSVTGLSECGMCDKFNDSIDMNAMQYHSMVDKRTSVTNLESTNFYRSSVEGDLPVSKNIPHSQESDLPVSKNIPHSQEGNLPVSNNIPHSQEGDLPVSKNIQHSQENILPVTKNIPHSLDFGHFDISNAANKQYSQNSGTTTYLHMEACLKNSDTNTHEKPVLQCIPLNPDLSQDVDTGSSKVAETDSSKVHQMESCHKLGEVINNENIKVNSSAVDHFSSTSIDKTALNENMEGEVMSVVTNSELVLNSEMNTEFGPGTSKLPDQFYADRFYLNDYRLQEGDKLLLDEFDIICKFLKNVLDFELDRQLVLPKLEEILSIAKLLLDDGCRQVTESFQREEIKHEGRETLNEPRSKKYRNSSNEMCNGDVFSSDDEKGIGEDDNEPMENNSPTVSVIYSSIDTEAEKEITDVKETKHTTGGTKVKVKTYKGMNSSRNTKWIKCEILNCHEGMNRSFELKSKHLFKNEEDSGEEISVKSKRDVELKSKERRGQKCTSDKKILPSNKRNRKQDKNEHFISKDESAKFRWKVNRNMRMHKYHRKCEIVPPDLDADSYSVLEKGFYCPDCQFVFKGKNKLILHKRLKSGYCLPDCIYCDADQQKDVYQCTKCPKCFQTKQMLERHEERHAQILRCNLCILEFYTSKDLKFHLQTVHAESALPTFLCDLCGSKFKERKVLNAHRRFVHSNERPEVCTSCNKCFKTKSQLKNHLVTHKQVSELNLSCEICGKMFLRVATLKDHVRRHKKEFSCYCTICNKGFYRKYGLEEHMRVHTGDKPFDCKFCGFKCALSCNLVKHMKIHQKYSVN